MALRWEVSMKDVEKEFPTAPRHTLESMKAYAEYGRPTGGFLEAVLDNNLSGAVGRADSGNLAGLADIVKFMYNRLPNGCWGSPARVNAWLSEGWRSMHEEGSDE